MTLNFLDKALQMDADIDIDKQRRQIDFYAENIDWWRVIRSAADLRADIDIGKQRRQIDFHAENIDWWRVIRSAADLRADIDIGKQRRQIDFHAENIDWWSHPVFCRSSPRRRLQRGQKRQLPTGLRLRQSLRLQWVCIWPYLPKMSHMSFKSCMAEVIRNLLHVQNFVCSVCIL